MKTTGIKKIGALLIAGMLIFSLAACNNDLQGNTNPPSSTAPSSSGEIKLTTITDREGKTIVIPEKIDRIVSMAPSITETLVHLGLGDKIVATDKYSAEIDGLAANLPIYDMMAPDTENIAALKPDILFATGMSKSDGDDPFKTVTDLGVIMTYVPSSDSLEGIKEDIRFLGQVTGTNDQAQIIITDMEKEISDIVAKIGEAKSNKKVYFEIGAAPRMFSFGTGTFLNEIIELLGAKNILADQEGWVSVSEEWVIDKNPDIIFTNLSYVDNAVEEILGRNGWNVITAIKDKAVYQIDKNTSSRPNEYVSSAIKEMAKVLYPDLFE